MKKTRKKLELRRAARGHTRATAAEALGVSRSLVTQVETGAKAVTLHYIENLCSLPKMLKYRDDLIESFISEGGEVKLSAGDQASQRALTALYLKWGNLTPIQLFKILELLNED